MVLYLQANYCGTFAIAELNKWQNLESDNPFDWDTYFTLEDNIPGDTPIVEINKMVAKNWLSNFSNLLANLKKLLTF